MNTETENAGAGFHIYQRDLPHWRSNAVIYFVTWRLHKAATPLEPHERTLVSQILEHFHKNWYWLVAYVVMDDHVHVLVRLADGVTLQKTIHNWKSYSANRLQRQTNRSGPVWQPEYYDRIVRNEPELARTQQYIALNPQRKWPDECNYQWLRLSDN